MAKKYLKTAFAAVFLFTLLSCAKESKEAKKPVYLSIEDMFVTTNYSLEGTSHMQITTVWLEVNGKSIGAFEMPATPPVILNEGSNKIRLYEGITMNGIDASRAIYDRLDYIEFDTTYVPSGREVADTMVLTKGQRTTNYASFSQIDILETFDNAGLSFEKTSSSDTSIIKSNNPSDWFINPQDPTENNGKCGVLYTNSKADYAEVATVNSYDLPSANLNVYLEMNYRSNIPMIVGVIAETSTGAIEQKATLGINPKEDWNKIYVNLVTETSSYFDGTKYKIFISAEHQSGLDTGYVYLDNLKLVY
ncbi:hypothetical protein Oweho_0902 [Owenweeksia hongkongensis DSM 17368]|uniref:Carbohydrate metabolism domain-containing protein n=1 Tax=Owenweeksia hongkongensis (strain DSM 17368 / CIP 108786 / JCM 12287 / NRRL B-23963 / UST20020801) TaxID=926562 RepID=G8R392_OWEHD|nr:hypothetical protein [Owenweeksia hongkongensis]AEV31913.1 hypothetical protein Oweho_0902 [Owenweeksia hongkongensis DSM 17368]